MSDTIGSGLAIPNPLNRPEGLEDFGVEEQVMPIIRINHGKGVFVDALTQLEYSELNVVILGRVRGRVLWPAKVASEGSTDQPLCRSYDFNSGIPHLIDKDGDPDPDRFPWDAAGFSATSSPLPCATCKLKEWDSHPNRDAPWCSEVHNFGIALPTEEDGVFQPSIIQIQRSSIGSSKTYCTSFASKGVPMFTVWTNLSLERKKRGSNDYCVIQFKELQPSDPGVHPFFSATYRGIRQYLTTPRVDVAEDNNASLPVTPTETPVQVQQEVAPVAVPEPVSEAPVAAPVAAPAPVAPAPAPAAPAAPLGGPMAAAAPAPAPAPAAPAAPAPAAPAPAPVAPAAAAPAVSDELPF